MKKLVVLAVVVAGLVAVAKRFGPNVEAVDWEKAIERMPDNAPPKWIFKNVRSIRENTDRILELLERDRAMEPTGGGDAAV